MNLKLLALFCVICLASFVTAYPAPEDDGAIQEVSDAVDSVLSDVEQVDSNNDDDDDDDEVDAHRLLGRGNRIRTFRTRPTTKPRRTTISTTKGRLFPPTSGRRPHTSTRTNLIYARPTKPRRTKVTRKTKTPRTIKSSMIKSVTEPEATTEDSGSEGENNTESEE